MKRLVFCFDGTWNRLDANNPTNVVHTARSISSIDNNGVPQIVYYDEGVGTKRGEKWRGGVFGKGLLENLSDAYKFLVFNYDVGDEIYIFGFSRGAFSARSFAGLIFHSGVVDRLKIKRIPEAIIRYQKRKKDDDHNRLELLNFRKDCSPQVCVDERELKWRLDNGYCTAGNILSDEVNAAKPTHVLRIKYIGVWDTVGALGIPKSLSFSSLVNRKYQFHDCNLSDFVTSARHAVAIDEQRTSFEPTVWENIDQMNASLGFDPSAPDAPYQQQWFPGVHGAVGGGGDYTGLSDESLDWVLEGAKQNGLEITSNTEASIYQISPDYKDNLSNMKPLTGLAIGHKLSQLLPKKPRRRGRPTKLHQVSMSTKYRWKEEPKNLSPKEKYRPKLTLDKVSKGLDAWNFGQSSSNVANLEVNRKTVHNTYVVQNGDTLGDIAHFLWNDSQKYMELFSANQPMLTDPNRIYPGQVLVIPPLNSVK